MWAGIRRADCPVLGRILVNRVEIPLVRLRLGLHCNKAKSLELSGRIAPLELPEGISVHPRGTSNAPRLPLLGLRGLVRNGLRLTIDGNSVSLKSPSRGVHNA
jgi:hypothetical protein